MKKLLLSIIFCVVAVTTFSQTYSLTIAQDPNMANITGYTVHVHVKTIDTEGNYHYYCWGSQTITYYPGQRVYPPITFTKYLGDPGYPVGTLVSYIITITTDFGDTHTFTFNAGVGVGQIGNNSNGTTTLIQGTALPVTTFYLNTIN